LAHNPPLALVDPTRSKPEDTVSVARVGHPRCLLVLVEYSGGPVSIGCPPHSTHPHDVRWMEIGVARLVAAVLEGPMSPNVSRALDDLLRGYCWDEVQIDKIMRAVDGRVR
jgi:hypothetical protein